MSTHGGTLNEPMQPVREDAQADEELVEWITSRIVIPGYNKEMWTEEHSMIASEYILSPNLTKLTAHVENEQLLLHINEVPPLEKTNELMYYIKRDETVLSKETMEAQVQYGMVTGSGMGSLLVMMNGVYLPTFLHNDTWPESKHLP